MSLSREQVLHVSLLSRLQLTDAELDTMTGQLGNVIEYVNQLSELDTESVEPMAHAMEMTNVFAEDVVHESLPRDEALANAPNHNQEFYLVPAVLGDN